MLTKKTDSASGERSRRSPRPMMATRCASNESRPSGRTDGRADGRTDKPSFTVARRHLKLTDSACVVIGNVNQMVDTLRHDSPLLTRYVEKQCTGNSLFNPTKLFCDYPENVLPLCVEMMKEFEEETGDADKEKKDAEGKQVRRIKKRKMQKVSN